MTYLIDPTIAMPYSVDMTYPANIIIDITYPVDINCPKDITIAVCSYYHRYQSPKRYYNWCVDITIAVCRYDRQILRLVCGYYHRYR